MDRNERQAAVASGNEPNGLGAQVTVASLEPEASALDEEERDLVGDLGSELDDPEASKSESSDYGMQGTDSSPLTRAAFLRHRMAELFEIARSRLSCEAPAWPANRVSDAQWRGLADSVYGLRALTEFDDGGSSVAKQPAPSTGSDERG